MDPSSLTDINPDDFMKAPEKLSEKDQAEAKRLLNLPGRTTLEIMFLLKNLYYRVKMEEEKLGTEAVAKILAKRKDSQSIEFESEKVGKAEPLVINTERGPLFFTKVRHNELKMSILFIDKNQIDLELLQETESLLKLTPDQLAKKFPGQSKQQIQRELDHRKFITKQMRTLYSRMLMSEWNPKLEYQPLNEIAEKKPMTPVEETAPEELQSRVSQVMTDSIEDLNKKTWFKKMASKSYDTWVDLAKQEAVHAKANPGNEAVMVVFFDGDTGKILETNTVKKPSKFTFNYWKTYWTAIWEKPAYGESVWKNNKGLGKLKVLMTGDYLMGLSFGLALGTLSFLTASGFPEALPHGLTPFGVARISFVWSLFFGVFGKTWANFVYRGNEFVRFTKNWAPGITQSYSFNLASNESLSVLDPKGNLDQEAIKKHLDVLANQSIKTVTKTSNQEIARTRAKTGEAEGTLKVPYYRYVLPWKNNMKFAEFEYVETKIDTLKLLRWVREQFTIKEREKKSWEDMFVLKFHKDIKITLPWAIRHEYDTHIPRQNYENQAVQFITTPVGLLSRFGYTVWGIPLGHILYMILGPIGEVRQIRYKREFAEQIAQNYGEEHPLTKRWRALVMHEIMIWQSLRIFNIPGSQFVGYYVKTVPKQVLEAARDLGIWSARKIAYSTYETYLGIEKRFKDIAEDIERRSEMQRRYDFLMTVQTEQGKPHRQQVDALKKRLNSNKCSTLFE